MVAGEDRARTRRRQCAPSRHRLPTTRIVPAGSLGGEPQRQYEANQNSQGTPQGPALGASDALLSLGGLAKSRLTPQPTLQENTTLTLTLTLSV